MAKDINLLMGTDKTTEPEDTTRMRATDIPTGIVRLQHLSDEVTDEFGETSTDGWVADENVWVYASATTFTIAGDQTTIFTAGTKLKFTQTTDKYAVVASNATYTAPNTLVTILTNTDYTIANEPITAPYHSYQENPQGFPDYFNYTITLTNVTLGNGAKTGKFKVIGKTMLVVLGFQAGTTTTYAAAQFQMDLPISPPTPSGWTFAPINYQPVYMQSNGTVYAGLAQFGQGSTVSFVTNVSAPAAVTSTVPNTWQANANNLLFGQLQFQWTA